MVLSTDWSQYSVTPQIKGKVNQIKRMINHIYINKWFFLVCPAGALLVSGIYDLLPILSTYVNDPLKMTEYATFNAVNITTI